MIGFSKSKNKMGQKQSKDGKNDLLFLNSDCVLYFSLSNVYFDCDPGLYHYGQFVNT